MSIKFQCYNEIPVAIIPLQFAIRPEHHQPLRWSTVVRWDAVDDRAIGGVVLHQCREWYCWLVEV